MSSPSPPKPQKINPYQGMDSDPEFYKKAQELGYTNVNNPAEVAAVNALIMQDRVDYKSAQGDKYWNKALMDSGKIRFYDEKTSYRWHRDQGYSKKHIDKMNREKSEQYGTKDWYLLDEKASDLSEFEFSEIQSKADSLKYDAESKRNQQQLQKNYERTLADQKASAEEQRKMMEEMMNQPVYMPKQQQMPVVQKPEVRNDPILPAPAPNTPMSIAAPPAPELTNTGNRMAIVRTPASTQARSRRATRGTSSLTN